MLGWPVRADGQAIMCGRLGQRWSPQAISAQLPNSLSGYYATKSRPVDLRRLPNRLAVVEHDPPPPLVVGSGGRLQSQLQTLLDDGPLHWPLQVQTLANRPCRRQHFRQRAG